MVACKGMCISALLGRGIEAALLAVFSRILARRRDGCAMVLFLPVIVVIDDGAHGKGVK